MRCRRLRCVGWRTSVNAICARWERSVQARCAQWETTWRQLCSQWETTWQQTCREWETRQERRCDRWEEEQRRNCDSWGPFGFICLFWVLVTTWVCRAWVWVTTTICKVWEWVSTTLCKLWTWVSTTLCKLWELITTFVCRLWAFVTTVICTAFGWFVDLFCIIACVIRRWSAPNEVSESMSECVYGWTAAYRVDEDRECALRVTLRIRLNPDPGVTAQQLQAAQQVWEPAIEQAWTDRFRIRLTDGDCRCREYRVTVDVQWVTSNEHHAVRVQAGSGRANMTNWFITSTGGTAAHEAGHMFGYADEYADPACPNRVVTTDGSIMRNSQTGTVRPRHYARLARWISNRTCCLYDVRERD
jgi:hypothetical protein